MWAIETRQLTKTFATGLFRRKQVTALESLDLQIVPGEIFGYVGHNGAGKTTTFKLILGLLHATSGEAWIFGESIRRAQTRAQIGFLPEQPYFYQHLTATQFLAFYADLFELDAGTKKTRIPALLERVGLSEVDSTPLRSFSKGMLQRIGIAQALINDPTVIILDEPMSGLDPMGRKEVRELILDLRDQGKTVIFSSHILSDVEIICDRVGILMNGCLQRVEETHGLIESAQRQYELIAQGLSEVALEELREVALEVKEQVEGVMVAALDETATERAQELIRRHHGRLLALTPKMPSLESLFLGEASHPERKVQRLRGSVWEAVA